MNIETKESIKIKIQNKAKKGLQMLIDEKKLLSELFSFLALAYLHRKSLTVTSNNTII